MYFCMHWLLSYKFKLRRRAEACGRDTQPISAASAQPLRRGRGRYRSRARSGVA